MSQSLFSRVICKSGSACTCYPSTARLGSFLSNIRETRLTKPKIGESQENFNHKKKQDWYKNAQKNDNRIMSTLLITGTIVGGSYGLYKCAEGGRYPAREDPYLFFGFGSVVGLGTAAFIGSVYPFPLAMAGLVSFGLIGCHAPQITDKIRAVINKK